MRDIILPGIRNERSRCDSPGSANLWLIADLSWISVEDDGGTFFLGFRISFASTDLRDFKAFENTTLREFPS